MLGCCGYLQLAPAGMLKGSGGRGDSRETEDRVAYREFSGGSCECGGVLEGVSTLTIVKKSPFFLGLIHVHLVIILSCDPSVLGEQAGCRDMKSQETPGYS